MRERGTGHIINVSSIAGRKLAGGAAVYCATKHAVHALSEGLRAELSSLSGKDGSGIRVTVIAPGLVRTELPGSITHEETRGAIQGWYDNLPAPLESEDVADAIVYAIEAPAHAGINEIVLRPTSQEL